MKVSALAGLSALLGHQAVTVCLVIANRRALNVEINYKEKMKHLVQAVLDRI